MLASVVGRRLPLIRNFSASPLEKFPGYSEINSAISDLASVISNKFTKADTQIPFIRGGYRPILLKNSKIFLAPNLFAM